jgi:hypothetical protein
MQKSFSHFWTLPVVTAYIYALTILSQYGYNSYFNISPSFIEASIRANVIFLYDRGVLFWSVIKIMPWWVMLLNIVTIAVIVIVIAWLRRRKTTAIIVSIIAGILLLNGAMRFGYFLAAHQTDFLVASSDCAPVGPAHAYIAPITYDGKAVFVPIDENKKVLGGFIVKDMAQMSCVLQYKTIGITNN